MYYAIDFDTRLVESKSTDGELLANYVLDNDLSIAVAIVDSEDELCLQFSLKEMQELSDNLGGKTEYDSEEKAAELCWRLLEQCQDDIPNFNSSLSKKLLRAAAKRCKDSPSKNAEANVVKPAKKRTTSSKPTAKRLTDTTVLTLGEQPKENTLLFKIWQTVEDNLGDMPIGEIVNSLSLELEERLLRRYINKMVRLENFKKVK